MPEMVGSILLGGQLNIATTLSRFAASCISNKSSNCEIILGSLLEESLSFYGGLQKSGL